MSETYAWRARLLPGMRAEYQRRHNEIWPELVEVLREAGIHNYTIFENNGELFGYYECEKGVQWAAGIQRDSPVVKKWNAYMTQVMEMPPDPVTGAQPRLDAIWHLD